MTESITVNRKKRGRPPRPGGRDPVVAVRLPPAIVAELDRMAALEGGRANVLRRLVELGTTQEPGVRLRKAKRSPENDGQRAPPVRSPRSRAT